ncbi:hypothetical protein [Paraburkholderia sp. C35]|uniref:hypothetical protein n=1 Tax=Paraburkholderia sp. C35 TaxID=2126993 RepID=UPI000D696946|nr:hypothetical protein [Paraburkholderia sp. C35]
MNAIHSFKSEEELYRARQQLDAERANHVGYMQGGPFVTRRGTIEADPVGYNYQQPKEVFAPGEREAFQAKRDRLDRAMQVAGICPVFPQSHQTPATYERALLDVLTEHTVNYTRADCLRASDEQLQIMRDGVRDGMGRLKTPGILDEVLAEPHRKGIMKEIKTVDQSGREWTEFVGPKSLWMNPLKGQIQGTCIAVDGKPQRF